jgi:hypothetical protein
MFIAGIKLGFHFWLATVTSRVLATGMLSVVWIGTAACAVTVLAPLLIGDWASRHAARLRVPPRSNLFRLQEVLWSKAPESDELEGDGVIYTPPEILLHEFPVPVSSPNRECRETAEKVSA